MTEYEPQRQKSLLADRQDIRCVLADPPWDRERGGGQSTRGAQAHYPLLPPEEIVRVIQTECPQWRRLCDSAHLWLWVTNATLAAGEAHFVADGLGFRPLTLFTWRKVTADGALQKGLGQYSFGATEHLLLCVKGEAMLPDATDRWPTVFDAERTEHSRKPDISYELIEDTSPGARLELFARRRRDGWLAWGNEIQEKVSA